jgi:predicted nucleic acid-binding protein
MSRLFVDTFYRVALLHRRDAWHDRAVAFSHTLTSDDALLTTDAILVEFLAAFSNMGQHLRQKAAITAHHLLDRPNIIVIPQDRMLFLEGLDLYERRVDKQYSLTDCISMQVMHREGITEVLTNDHHFTQEGFRVLFS